MPKWNGGVIGVANNPTQSAAKGIWSLSEATKAIRAGLWPPSNAGADPYFENVTLLLPGDGTNGAQNNTFLDSSTNGFTITRNGNTTQGTFSPFSKVDGRWGAYFDGSGDYLTAAQNSAFNLGTGAFTVETWVYPTSVDGSLPINVIALGRGAYSTSVSCGWGVWINANKTVRFYRIVSGGSEVNRETTNTINLNQWNHIVACRDASSNLSIYINGVRGYNASSATTSYNNVDSDPLIIGRIIVGGGATTIDLSGYVSNPRIVVGTAVYDPTQSTLTVPTGPLTAISGTSLLTCQSNRFIDNSTNAFAITRNGDVAVTPFSPFPSLTAYAAGTNGGSGYFDGSSDYLALPTSSQIIPATGDFTFEGWVYPLDVNNYYSIYSQTDGTSSSGRTQITCYQGNLSLQIGASSVATTGNPVKNNQWNYVAITRTGSSVYLYVNGAAGVSATLSGTVDTGSSIVYAGGNWSSSYFYGYIGSLRISNNIRSSLTTVPTSPYSSDANTRLLLSGTNGGIIDTSMSNDLETVGNAQISTTQSKFGGASMYFDGSGDMAVLRNTPDLRLSSTEPFTIEFWVYANSLSSDQHVIGAYNLSSPYQGYGVGFGSGGIANTSLGFWDGTGSWRVVGSGFSTGTWYHVAIASEGSSNTGRFFVNGTQQGSSFTVNSTIANSASTTITLGARQDNATNFNGYIDDLRITKGKCRYTANFTAPVGPFNAFGD